MFERFNEEAIRVLTLAQEEAHQLQTAEIGTACILLGLVGETQGIAGQVLRQMDVDLLRAKNQVGRLISSNPSSSATAFSQDAQLVLEQALQETRQLGRNVIGTEHLLLAIASLKQTTAYQVLENLHIDIEQLQAEILAAMSEAEISDYEFRTAPSNDLQDLAQELDHLIDQLSQTLAIAKSRSEVLKRRIRSRSLTHSEAIDQIQKLPNSPEGIATQEILTELQTTITSDSHLLEEDKTEIRSQIQLLARVWQVRQEEKVQKIARRSLQMIRGIVTDLPADAPQSPTYQKLVLAIAEQFQLKKS